MFPPFESVLTGIFRESLSDFRRNQFLSCAVFKVRFSREAAEKWEIGNGKWEIEFAQVLSSSFSLRFLANPQNDTDKRVSQVVGSAFALPTISIGLTAPLSICLPFSPVLRMLLRSSAIFNSQFPIPHSQFLQARDLRIRTKLSASYIAP